MVMLAPNVTVMLPAAIVAIAGLAPILWEPVAAYALLWFAYAGLLVGAGIKLVRHVDGVRPSRVIAAMLASRTAEVAMLRTIGLAVAGAALLATASSVPAAVGGPFVLAGSGATALGVLYWETARTLLVSHIDDGWGAS